MRKLMMAVAATAVLASAALFADARPAVAQAVSQDALKTAFETGQLQVSYVQRRGGGRGGLLIVVAEVVGPSLIVEPAVAALWPIAARAVAVPSPIAEVIAGPFTVGDPIIAAAITAVRITEATDYGYGGAALGLATGAIVGGAIAAQQPVYAAPGGELGGLLCPAV